MPFYRSVGRPLLFRLSPDRSHALAQYALRASPAWWALAKLERLQVDDPRLRTRFAGVDLASPVGLAAGFDKNCELISALSFLGFGFLTVGSIMPEPRFGNPFPRLVRYPESQSLADAMGVPSRGLAYCVDRLTRAKQRRPPLFANIGGFSAEAIAAGLFAVEPHVDGVEISLMCPNLLGPAERFDDIALLKSVLERIAGRCKPVIVRVPNDTARSSDRLAEMIECCVEAGIEGLKIGGGWPVAERQLGVKQGTLHGRAIFDVALGNVARAAGFARGRIAIKGNGGVNSADDVIAMLRAGATCVDLYSAFIYQGWTVARDINRALAPLLEGLVAACSPDGAKRNPGSSACGEIAPHCASLHLSAEGRLRAKADAGYDVHSKPLGNGNV
jgi:dihydroorotate dehydrogenase (fumarate)/dihydroorotate dehydrogenase